MIIIDQIETVGWRAAIRGMRNPMNSWDKSDSMFYHDNGEYRDIMGDRCPAPYGVPADIVLGPNDLDLAIRLSKGGPVHGKFKRMIVVYMDINAPLYWWKEFDTYKIGTVANSCSTMHKIHAKRFELDDFSHEHLYTDDDCDGAPDHAEYITKNVLKTVIKALNYARNFFLENKSKKSWWQMIQLLPTSYNQKRTVMLNYGVLTDIYHYRKDHKLDEWHDFCAMIETLPYAKELIIGEN